MDSLKSLLYTLSRIGLMILLALFGLLCGAVLFPCIATLFPSSMQSVKYFLTDPVVCSIIGFVIMTAFLVVVFYDDGKKHAAYETWSWMNILVVLIIMLMVAFIPAAFRESFKESETMSAFYRGGYYTTSWLTDGEGLGLNHEQSFSGIYGDYSDEEIVQANEHIDYAYITKKSVGMNYVMGTLAGTGIQLVLAFAAYYGSFRLYAKRHPVILKRMEQLRLDDEAEEDE